MSLLTSKTNLAQDVLEATPPGPHQGRSHCQTAEVEKRSAAFDSPPRVLAPIYTVTRLPAVEHLNLMPRQGDEPIRRVAEPQARSLLALGLVDPICRSRRGVIVALRVRLGVSVAAINAALRHGMGNQVPIAEDNRTVAIAAGCVATFEFVRTKAWDDGRNNCDAKPRS